MDYLNDILTSLKNLGPEALAGAAVIALGYVLRLIPTFPNKWIPLACVVLAPCVYPFLTSASRVSPDVQNPMVRIVLTGFLIGVIAWIVHDKVIARVEDKLFGFLAQRTGSKRYRKTPDGKFEEILYSDKGRVQNDPDKKEPPT